MVAPDIGWLHQMLGGCTRCWVVAPPNATPYLTSMKQEPFLFLLVFFFLSCQTEKKGLDPVSVYETETLKIIRLKKGIYQHVSYLPTKSFGRVPCNGMIVTDKKEALVFDTPTTDSVSLELIQFIEEDLQCNTKAIVVNHFHVDCLGGLKAFHDNNIMSYANYSTIEAARNDKAEIPRNGFNLEDNLVLFVGEHKVINAYYGPAHSYDNIVSYVPGKKALFGGCMLKSNGAGKGNTKDGDENQWSNTVKTVSKTYQDVEVVIPGHGAAGGKELLDFTEELFLQ